jgi:hypothetical protein
VSITSEIDTSELRDLIRDIGRLPEQTERILVGAVWKSLLLLEREIKERTPVGVTGLLRQSIAAHRPRVDIGGRIVGEVGTPLSYAESREKGTKPHFPPVEALEDWVRAKLGIAPAQARSVAFLVARKIAMVGTEGAFMFAGAFEATEDQIERFFNVAFRQVRDAVGTPQ